MASDSGVIDRVKNFVADNKRAVVCTAVAAVAVGGLVYYTSTSRDADKKSKNKRKGKSSKKRKTSKDGDGPILEERSPSLSDQASDANLSGQNDAEDPARLAASLKSRGNAAYQQRNYLAAADFYTQAIEISPKEDAVFYSNRAACYVNMSPPKYDLALQDCDEALRLDTHYLKALNRRASVLENLQRYEGALRDFTAATILDKFQNQTTAQSVERVLNTLATKKAADIIATREPRLPPHTFISAYFSAFRPRPLPTLPEEPSTGDNTLLLAFQALAAGDYIHSFTQVNIAFEQGVSWDVGRAEALNLRGTFKFLIGDVASAQEDLLASIDIVPSFVQSWVKVASVYMEQDSPTKAFECFSKAIEHNPDDPDIYYHRGQVFFIQKEFKQAADDYTKSTALDDQFVFSHIQLAVAQYKQGNLSNSMTTFRRTLKAFPHRSEPQNYYGELFLDREQFQEAIEKFDRAIELEKTKPPPPYSESPSRVGPRAPPMNALPFVNKGLALFQWKQDIVAAEQCCNEALLIDPECEAAVATLAQLNLQQRKTKEAIKLFARQAELARSEPELVHTLTYQYASEAQLEFLKNYPHMAHQLEHIARAMMI